MDFKSQYFPLIHDIQNSIQVIRGYGELFMDTRAGEDRQVVEQELKHLSQMVPRLTGVMKQNEYTESQVLVSAYSVVKKVFMRESLMHKSNIYSVCTKTRNEFLFINVWLNSFEELLKIVMKNAFKYTPLKGEIHVKIYLKGEFVNIFIENNRSRIIKSIGMGHGLEIAQDIIVRHGGRLKTKINKKKNFECIISVPKFINC